MSLAHDVPPPTDRPPSKRELFETARHVSIVNVARRYVDGWCKTRTRPALFDYWACCPFHQERTASFHVSGVKNVFNCFGCGENGDVIDLVAKLERIEPLEAATRLAEGLNGKWLSPAPKIDRRKLAQELLHEAQRKRSEAGARWQQCDLPPIVDGAVRPYLGPKCRGISASTVALVTRAGGAVREHCDQYNRRSMSVIALDLAGKGCAVQETPLRSDGTGKRGDRRFTTGVLKGGAAVQLIAPAAGELAVAEGVESALAFYDLHRIPCWALLGTANLSNFMPPAGIRRLYIAADNDAAGRSAAGDLFKSASKGVRCTMALPPDGQDWADVLAAQIGGAP